MKWARIDRDAYTTAGAMLARKGGRWSLWVLADEPSGDRVLDVKGRTVAEAQMVAARILEGTK